MPRALRDLQPTSAVARIFDKDAASRALASVPVSDRQTTFISPTSASEFGNADPMPLLRPVETDEPKQVNREFLLSLDTNETCSQLVELFRRSTRTRLSSSHVLRAILKGVAACMGSLEHEIRQLGRLKLPSNARGQERKRDDFEQRLAEAFINGIRSAAAYRRPETDR